MARSRSFWLLMILTTTVGSSSGHLTHQFWMGALLALRRSHTLIRRLSRYRTFRPAGKQRARQSIVRGPGVCFRRIESGCIVLPNHCVERTGGSLHARFNS
jgi:hypothetical protein